MLEVLTGESRFTKKGQTGKDLAYHAKYFVFYPDSDGNLQKSNGKQYAIGGVVANAFDPQIIF